MSIWLKPIDIDALTRVSAGTMSEYLGMEVTAVGDDYLTISMPVDARTHQPMGILHGGASVALAESVGSVAANLAVDSDHYCVGLEINANHIRSIQSGRVFGTATPIHIGKSTQVWNIHILDEQDRTICISRLTMAVMAKKK